MTTLGTPLSPTATKVMLLGSGELGKEVLIALQRLGVETIAVDRYDHAPGQQVAHHARTITMSDPVQLKALIEAERPAIVVPEIEAIATGMLEELERTGGLRVIPTARAARLTMDREGIRRLAGETLGLPTSPYVFADSLAELQAAIDGKIGYPCIVKPVMSSSGKGQSKVDGPADVARAWDHAMAGGARQPRAGDCRGLHRVRLRDHAAHRARPGRRRCGADALLRSHRSHPGAGRLRGELATARDAAGRAAARPRDRSGRDRQPRWPGPVRRGAVRQGRRGVVQRGVTAPARHWHGHDDHAVAERIRAACARHPRAAGGHPAEEPRAPAQ